MSSADTTAENVDFVPKWRGLGLYLFLLSVETGGVGILLANIIPLYRLMVVDFAHFKLDPRPWWAVVGMLLIQVAYWLGMRLRPPLPRIRNILLSHLISFVGRISFVVITASFTLIFLNKYDTLKDMDFTPLRALMVFVMFFSVFCWTLDLEHLAKALQGSKT